MAQDIDAALSSILDLQKSYEFSIIKLSEQIIAETSLNASSQTPDISIESIQNCSPVGLEADLSHYKVDRRFSLLISK